MDGWRYMRSEARYDGIADWYDSYARPSAESSRTELLSLLGHGQGLCLDLGCGTGLYFDAIRESGRSVVGIDQSADQLRIAGQRGGAIIQADAHALPFTDAVFPTVIALWLSTDVDDFAGVMRETRRILRPGGRLAVYGVHPCFNGPCVEVGDADTRVVHPTYRRAGWHESSPWWSTDGIRSRVGMRHLPLADLLNALLDAGLQIMRVTEPRDEPVPFILAILACRPA
jgi:ubiquinone/menaquinone biosynthesis C-methylase UbiE